MYELAGLIKSKKISAVDLAKLYIRRLKKYDDLLQASANRMYCMYCMQPVRSASSNACPWPCTCWVGGFCNSRSPSSQLCASAQRFSEPSRAEWLCMWLCG